MPERSDEDDVTADEEPAVERPSWFHGIHDKSEAPRLAKGAPAPTIYPEHPPSLRVVGNIGKVAFYARKRASQAFRSDIPDSRPIKFRKGRPVEPESNSPDLGAPYELNPDAPSYLAALRGETFYMIPRTDTLYKFRPVSRFEVWVLWGPHRNKYSRVPRSEIR